MHPLRLERHNYPLFQCEMSIVWAASWRPVCSSGRAYLQRPTVLSRSAFTFLSDAKPISQRISPIAGMTTATDDVRSTRPQFERHLRQRNGAIKHVAILPRRKSTFSVTGHGDEQASRLGVKPLSESKIAKIFGTGVGYKEGNAVLRNVQHQRITGTLDHPLPAQDLLKGKALAWLRKTYFIDEEAAIVARIDQELEKEDKDYASTTNNYSHSVLDEIKARNLAKAAREREVKEKAEQAREHTIGPKSVTSTPRAVVARRPESPEWVRKYKEKATSKLTEPPTMTKFERLWPSTLLVLAVVGFSALFAQNYHPPSRKARLWPDIPPVAATIITLIGFNVFIFLLWRLPQAWYILNRRFAMTPGYPSSTSMIGNFFSHQKFSHLAMNMVLLWVIGTGLHNDIGRGNFLAVFLTCGAVSSYISLSVYVFRNILYTSSIGASGAICGLLATWLTLDHHKEVSFLFLPDHFMQGWSPYVVLGLMIVGDILGATKRLAPPGVAAVDHVSHLGGYVAGLWCAQAFRYQRRLRQPISDEKRNDIKSADEGSQSRMKAVKAE